MKSQNLLCGVVVFLALNILTLLPAYAKKNNDIKNADPLGDFISNKKLMKPSSEGEPQPKTQLNLSSDPMAQFMVDKKIMDLSEIEFIKPTEQQLTQMKKKYLDELDSILNTKKTVFSNLGQKDVIQIFSAQGFDDTNCVKPACEISALTEPPFEMITTGRYKLTTTYNEFNVPDFSVSVEIDYSIIKNGEKVTRKGWILADEISDSEKGKIYQNQKIKQEKNPVVRSTIKQCDPKNPETEFFDNTQDIDDKASTYVEKLQKQIEQLKSKVGQCLMKSPRESIALSGEGLVYDQKVLPAVRQELRKKNNAYMTAEQVLTIDGAARTIYAEMGKCVSKGLQYPLTVARIMLNRARYIKEKNKDILFVSQKSKHSDFKNPLLRVMTEPSQFSAWLKTIKGRANPSLMHLLCPPSGRKDFFWNSEKVPESEKRAWNASLEIATEMVLHTQEFEKRTQAVADIYYYTSGEARIKGITGKVNRVVDGRSLSLSSCINIFNDSVR